MNLLELEEWEVKMQKDIDESKSKIAVLMEEELLDDDGYPTDAALEIIKLWHWNDEIGWFDFIKSIWHLRSWGWNEGLEEHEWDKGKQVYRYNISTAGWSGNESIIHAIEQNRMLMGCTWVQSRRGGHYIFERRDL